MNPLESSLKPPLFLTPSSPKLPKIWQGAVAIIGNFDGLHLGHRYLIDLCLGRAQEKQSAALMISFEPHPRQFFAKDAVRFRLTPPHLKQELLQDLGIGLVNLPFDQHLASLSPTEFIKLWLTEKCGVAEVIVGEDFCFGYQRQGTIETLRQHGLLGMAVPKIAKDGQVVSSSLIRQELAKPNLHAVRALLGGPYRLAGKVVKGQQLGRELGYPTANLDMGAQLGPAFGIYLVKVFNAQNQFIANGVASYGIRPTLNDERGAIFEIYLLDWQGDLYGQDLRVDLWEYLRSEQAFPDLTSLTLQMAEDVRQAKRWFASPPA